MGVRAARKYKQNSPLVKYFLSLFLFQNKKTTNKTNTVDMTTTKATSGPTIAPILAAHKK